MPNAADRAVPGNRIKTQQLHNRGNSHARLCGHGREGTRRRRLIVRARVLAGDGRIDFHCSRAITPRSVHFQRGRRARGHQTAILQNRLPCRGRCGRRFATGSVVILQNLNLPIDQTHAACPFPHIPYKVSNARRAVIVSPTDRTGTSQRAPVQSFVIHTQLASPIGQRTRFVLHFVVQAPIRISARLKARLETHGTQQCPFGIAHQMPPRPLGLAVIDRLVKIQRMGGFHAGKTDAVLINNGRRIHANEQFRLFNAVDDERRVRARQAKVGVHVFNLTFRDAPHVRRMPAFIIQYGYKAARSRFHAGSQSIFRDNGRHFLFLRLGFLNSPQNQPHGGHILFL